MCGNGTSARVTSSQNEMGEQRHFHIASTRVDAKDASVNISLPRHVHLSSSLYSFNANYEHLVDIMVERLLRAERDAELEDFTPLVELRLKASGMAAGRVGTLDFYKHRNK